METKLIAAGTQISLVAGSKGLGNQWITALPAITDPVAQVLETGDDLHLVFALALGHPRSLALPHVRKPLYRVLDVLCPGFLAGVSRLCFYMCFSHSFA